MTRLECLLGTSHYARCFACSISSNPPNSSTGRCYYYSCFTEEETKSLTKVTQRADEEGISFV